MRPVPGSYSYDNEGKVVHLTMEDITDIKLGNVGYYFIISLGFFTLFSEQIQISLVQHA